jgi:CubicO group peptidase (beta-lactamase class C family)
MDRVRPETVVELGLMAGSPPPPGRVVTAANWSEAPFQRWSFLHTREVMPSARIWRGDGPVSPMPREPRDLSSFAFRHHGEDWTLRQMMDATYVDGLMVVHDGRVIFEDYVDGMTPATTHLCQSVSKSLTATLTGVLVGDGRLSLDATVPDVIEELRGTSWDGCTIQHLLDMRAGVAFDESDYENTESESWRGFRALGWIPPLPDDPEPAAYIAQMRNQSEHGGVFEYRSILTDVLGWVMERAAGEPFADLFSREVWAPMGAAHDGDFLVGPNGFPLTDGGFCITLEDLARFGLLHLQGGEIGGRQVVPREWTQRVVGPNLELAQAFTASPDSVGFPVGAYYRDQWWVIDPEREITSGYGIHGQQVLVHRPSNSVVARFSSWPRPWVDEFSELADHAVLSLCDAILGGFPADPEDR